MWRHIASNALTLMMVLLFLGGGVLIFAQNRYFGPGPLAQAICLEVPRGATFSGVSENLEARGAIPSGFLFRVGADYAGKADDLKAGSYLVEPQASMSEIVDQITEGGASTCGTEIVYRVGVTNATVQVREIAPATGRYEEVARFDPAEEAAPDAYEAAKADPATRYRVLLAEGVTSWQIVEELKNVDILEGIVAELPAEGSLAPDSYEVRPGDTRQGVIDRMAAAQETILLAAWEDRQADLPLESPEEALILASIIEKETAVAEERRQVSSVFVNRLNRGMRLQTDPTVIYGITRGQGTLGRGLRRSELDRETPWNTYRIDGLPPTPIANPGRAAIEAAVNPDETPYIYFVADGTGGHAFAVTLAEHNENVARWRRIEAERAGE